MAWITALLSIWAFSAAAAFGTSCFIGRIAMFARAGGHSAAPRYHRISEVMNTFSRCSCLLLWGSLLRYPDQGPVLIAGMIGLVAPWATWNYWQRQHQELGLLNAEQLFSRNVVLALKLGMRGDYAGASEAIDAAVWWAPDSDGKPRSLGSLLSEYLMPQLHDQRRRYALAAAGKWELRHGDPRRLFVTLGRVDNAHGPTGVVGVRTVRRPELIPVSMDVLPPAPEADGCTRAWMIFQRGRRSPLAVLPHVAVAA